MKSTDQYIDEAKKALQIESDNAFAKWLGVTRAALSNYKVKKSTMDDYVAAKIAEALNINALEVIATANAEREKDSQKAEFWRKLASGAQVAALGSALIFSGLTYETQVVENQQNIHYAQLVAVLVLLVLLIWRKHETKENGV